MYNCPKCSNKVKESIHSSPKYKSFRCYNCNSLWDISDLTTSTTSKLKLKDFKFGDIVYHAEHPSIKGVVIGMNDDKVLMNRIYIRVAFEQEISFKMNPLTKDTVYYCCQDLLFETKEAQKNHRPF